MTSDHRVAGSSPAGCKSATRAALQKIYSLKFGGGETEYLPKSCHFWRDPLDSFLINADIYAHFPLPQGTKN